MIYFIRASEGGPIKIGTTIRLSRRLKQLMAEFDCGLELLAVMDGNRDEEQALHRRFGHLRVVNEWFEPGDDLVGFIVAEGRPWDLSDEAPIGHRAMTSRYVIPASDEHRDWMEGFMEKVGEVEVADAVREALRRWAESIGYGPPPKR